MSLRTRLTANWNAPSSSDEHICDARGTVLVYNVRDCLSDDVVPSFTRASCRSHEENSVVVCIAHDDANEREREGSHARFRED